MSCSWGAYFMKRISVFVRDWRDLPERQDRLEALFFRVSPVAPFPRMSCERRDARYVIRDRGQVPC